MLSKLWRSMFLSVLLIVCTGVVQSQSNSAQAAEAAKKHRADTSGVSSTTADKKSSKASGSVAQRLAACKASAELNVFKREQCVWAMCEGRWGRDGCPKEATPNLSVR